MNIVAEKKALRTEIHHQRAAVESHFKSDYDRRVCYELATLITERNCQVVHAYLPMGTEIDLSLIHI